MNHKLFVVIALAMLVLLLPLGTTVTAANPSSSTYSGSKGTSGGSVSQTLSLTLMGGVVSAGNQYYSIQQSGQTVMESMAGYMIDHATPSHLYYHLDAFVQGTSVSGNANFYLAGTLVGGGIIHVFGHAQIMSLAPAVCLPSGNTNGICESGDTSEVPAFFVGLATIRVSTSITSATQSSSQSQSMTYAIESVPMVFESAYLNPFGAPIVFGSADNFQTLMVVTTYAQASIFWSNVVVAGGIAGALGQTQIAGSFTEVSQEYENLVAGAARDSGIMTFSNVVDITTGNSINALDVTGTYRGNSIVPSTPIYACTTSTGVSLCSSSDCSSTIGLPGLGVCTSTGFQSMGGFRLFGHDSIVTGSYMTTWSIPAFAFAGTAGATASSGHPLHYEYQYNHEY
jgi:hypothetical protein